MTDAELYRKSLKAKRGYDRAVERGLHYLRFLREKFGQAAVDEIASRDDEGGESIREFLRLEKETDPKRN